MLGDGKQSVAKRWIRAATATRRPDAFMHALSQASWLPVGFVWDNVYLVGGGQQAERELSERRKIAVLRVLGEAYDEEAGELDMKRLASMRTYARRRACWTLG